MGKRVQNFNLKNLETKVINLGYVGENEHTQIVIECSEVLWDYPDAVASMVVQPPRGDLYPVEVTREENNIIWEITSSDVVYAGSGRVQLTFTNNGEIVKSAVGTTRISGSIEATGEAPEPLQNWMDQAEETARQMGQDVADATLEDLAETKAECIAEIEQAGADTRATIPADYTQLSDDVTGKVSKPTTSPNGTSGQLLRTNGDGTTTWVDQGLPTDAQTAEAVSAWLDEHPEATTTVQDGAITLQKLNDEVVNVAIISEETEKAEYHAVTPQRVTVYPDDRLTGITAKYSASKNLISKYFKNKTTISGISLNITGNLINLSGTGTGGFRPVEITDSEFVDAIRGRTFYAYLYLKKSIPWEVSSFAAFHDGVSNLGRRNFVSGSTNLIGWNSLGTITISENATRLTYVFNTIKDAVFTTGDCLWIGLYESPMTDTETALDALPYTFAVSGVDGIDTATHESIAEYVVPTKQYVDSHTPDIIGFWSEKVYVLPEYFGAIGDGIADDTTAISNCIAYAKTSGKAVRGFGKYKTTSTITMDQRGLNVYLKEIIYTGNSSAVCISNLEIVFEFSKITSSGVGIEFGGSDPVARQCQIKGNAIVSESHCLMIGDKTLYCTVEVRYLSTGNGNCIHRNYVNSWGGAEFIFKSSSCNCPNGWVAYDIGGSRFYDFTVEGNCKYGLYNPLNCVCYYWRHREQVDAMYYRISGDTSRNNGPLIKFTKLGDGINQFKYLSKDAIPWFSVDLSEFEGYDPVQGGEGAIDRWHALGTTGENCGFTVRGIEGQARELLSKSSYMIGGHLVIEPCARTRVIVDTTTINLALFDSANETDIVQAFSLVKYIGTDFIVDVSHADIYLNAYFGAIGFNDITVTQRNGNTAKIYDKLGNVLFDGTNEGDGKWRLTCTIDKESNGRYPSDSRKHYWWCYDGTNENWEIIKLA